MLSELVALEANEKPSPLQTKSSSQMGMCKTRLRTDKWQLDSKWRKSDTLDLGG